MQQVPTSLSLWKILIIRSNQSNKTHNKRALGRLTANSTFSKQFRTLLKMKIYKDLWVRTRQDLFQGRPARPWLHLQTLVTLITTLKIHRKLNFILIQNLERSNRTTLHRCLIAQGKRLMWALIGKRCHPLNNKSKKHQRKADSILNKLFFVMLYNFLFMSK